MQAYKETNEKEINNKEIKRQRNLTKRQIIQRQREKGKKKGTLPKCNLLFECME